MSEFPFPPRFIERMEQIYGSQVDEVLAEDAAPARGLRVNTLKCSVEQFQSLWQGALDPTPFCGEGFRVDPTFKAGADPLHHAGAYYMQEPSAMSAVTVLSPKPGEKILDLCAAPGGKSTQIAAALQGQGLLWCNEYVHSRAKILAQNIERLGVRNAVVSNADSPLLAERLPDFFDGVLVDAPCSGEGMFRKEEAALTHWSEDNIRLCADRGREILDAAAKMVRPGGRLTYSTCTFAPEENECQIAALLARHPDFTLVDTGVTFGRAGLEWDRVKAFADDKTPPDADLTLCRRITPADGGEGHFIALLQRQGERGTEGYTPPVGGLDEWGKAADTLYRECFTDEPVGTYAVYGGQVRLMPVAVSKLSGLPIVAAGFGVGEICKNRIEPCHSAFMAAKADSCQRCVDLSLDDPRVTAFLRGMEIPADGVKGWTAVAIEGVTVGFGKASNGVLKNRYPKGLRLL